MSHNPATTDSFVARMPFRNRGTLNLAAAISRHAKAALRHWQRHRATRTFQELDDWTLNDIGLTRNEIRRFVGDVLVPAPSEVSSARTGRSPMRPEDLSPAKRNGRRHTDAYLSWRDL